LTLGEENWQKMELRFDNLGDRCSFKNYPPSINFPDFPNNEHTQFVGTTIANQPVENLWNNIFVTPLEEHIIKGLHLFDQKIQKVGLVIKAEKNIPMIFVKDKRLPLKHLGEGLSRVFHIILALVNAKDGFLLIDEFENGLHYTVQPKVWELIFKLAKDLNVQVFATTHSWDCVESFHAVWESQEDEGTFYRLDNNPDEGISIMPYDLESLRDSLEVEVELR
jgi:AAA15 family ATPase/GTPase